jgi:hypothetical protein
MHNNALIYFNRNTFPPHTICSVSKWGVSNTRPTSSYYVALLLIYMLDTVAGRLGSDHKTLLFQYIVYHKKVCCPTTQLQQTHDNATKPETHLGFPIRRVKRSYGGSVLLQTVAQCAATNDVRKALIQITRLAHTQIQSEPPPRSTQLRLPLRSQLTTAQTKCVCMYIQCKLRYQLHARTYTCAVWVDHGRSDTIWSVGTLLAYYTASHSFEQQLSQPLQWEGQISQCWYSTAAVCTDVQPTEQTATFSTTIMSVRHLSSRHNDTDCC